jgi:mTERF domain-containing protein
MSQTSTRVLTFSPERLKVIVQQVEKLHMPGCSWAFKNAVGAVARSNEGIVNARMEFLSSSLGCSMEKLCSAVCKCPQILGLSESKLHSKIEFLVGKVGLEPDYILQRPVLLAFSLEKRLVPRHYVVEVLAGEGIDKKRS